MDSITVRYQVEKVVGMHMRNIYICDFGKTDEFLQVTKDAIATID